MALPELVQRLRRVVEVVRPVDDRRDRAALEQLGESLQIRVEELRDEKARLAKNWSEADACRNELLSKGYLIEDTPSGARLKRRSS